MSEPNIYENVDKYKGKVKYRNLDPELQKLIGSGGGGSGGSYDDTEIREQITEVKEDLKEYTDKYAELSTKVNNAATLTDLENYRKKSVDITYYDLDADLKNRIDNPDIAPGIDADKLNQISEDIDDLKAKNVINESNIQNNTTNISSLTENFNEFKQQTEAGEAEHSKTIASNTNRIEQLEDTIANGIDIDINQFSPEIQAKFELIDEITTDLSSLQQQVTNNKNDITVNKTNIATNVNNIALFQTNLDNLKTSINSSIGTINNTLNTHSTTIQSLENNLNTLSIDKIVNQNYSETNPDNGKIKEEHLSSELQNKLDELEKVSNDVENIINNNNNPGSTVQGTNGEFIYKTDTVLKTKHMMCFISMADTDEEFASMQAQHKGLIFNRATNILVEYDGTEYDEVINGFSNDAYNYIFLFDSDNNILYYNNAGMLDVVSINDDLAQGVIMGDWKLLIDEEDNLNVVHGDDVIVSFSYDDATTTSLMNTLNETYTLNESVKEETITIEANSSVIKDIGKTRAYRTKILFLDNNTNSPTYDLFIEDAASYTIAYTDNGLKIFNNKNIPIILKLIY